MTSKGERKVAVIENAQGGKGTLQKEFLLTSEEMGANCGLFGEVTIQPGASLGYHEHHNDTETYYITAGSGLYDD
ncbi:MAG: cupin domain-containing protein, partial [Lachnospiraceae bacterium]